ncbi:MAG: beta-galactosidase, partial [Spirochaetota bacterium]
MKSKALRGIAILSGAVLLTGSISYPQSVKDTVMKIYAKSDKIISSVVRKDVPYFGLGVTVAGANGDAYVPSKLFTFLIASKKDTASANSTQIALRNGKAYVGLMKLDTAKIPSDVDEAYFTFRPTYFDKSAGYSISFHRVLTPWDAAATWTRPTTAGNPWDGMKSSVDYDPQPFAQYSADAAVKSPAFAAGFAAALKKWASGEWVNDGFVMMISGDAIQMNMSTETNAKKSSTPGRADSVVLDGATSYALTINDAMINNLLIERKDLIDMSFILKIASIDGAVGDAALDLFRVTQNTDSPKSALDATPFISIPVKSLVHGDNSLSFTSAAVQWLNGTWENYGFVMKIRAAGSAPRVRVMTAAYDIDPAKKSSYFLMNFHSRESMQIFGQDIVPTPGVYAHTVNGKIYYGDKRLRLWGVCRHESENLFTAERIKRLGFNAVRIWGPRETGWYDDTSIKTLTMAPSGEGTGTAVDRYDRFFAECKKLGMFVMFPGLHSIRFPDALFADDCFLRGNGSDWQEWKSAIVESRKAGLDNRHYSFFDERMKLYFFNSAKNVLDHVNPYTGKRYADDEAICMYEVNNENGFIQWMLVANRIEKMPAYFKKKLMKRRSSWLKAKYTDDTAVVRAWGNVLPGESLATASYALAPVASDAAKYSKQRGDDFVEFMVSLVVNYNREFIEMCRSMAPKDIGINTAPFISDTEFMKNIPWLYANAAVSDAISFGIYSFTLSSSLTKPPAFYIVDHLTMKDKATVIYEFNAGRPNPYRTEWAYKMALLASWQDWDGAFFHYFTEPRGHGPKTGEDAMSHEEFLASKQWTPEPGKPQSASDASFGDGVDPAKYSAFAVAGRIFLS